jgi:broad specificity phosphatase PhoE
MVTRILRKSNVKDMHMRTVPISLVCASLLAFPAITYGQKAVILVRHAELQGAAMAEPKNLPLSDAGDARAKRLISILKDSDIGAIYVTDFVRTNKTGEPLARELKKDLTIVPKGDPQELIERLRKNNGTDTVLLVGHSDTLPGLLKALGHPADIKIEAQDYSNMFVVIPKKEGAPTFLRLRY